MDNLLGDLRLGTLRFAPLAARRRTKPSAPRAAAEYTGRWGWSVAVGAAPTRTDGRCDCGTAHCAAPGLHAGAGPALTARELDLPRTADGPLLLPTGLHFDVLDVQAQPGLQALVRLERMGTQLGPVLASPTGRLLFFVAPGTAQRLPDLLYRMGWDDASLDLACHGTGGYIAAPPTPLGGLGPMRWLRRPTRENAACPPEARLLLGTLAYACHRHLRDTVNHNRGARNCAPDHALT
ncbi:bifunctional DNA primase/polymerase [Kitasatospora sp. NPDC048365]|uniref:bifunctional DNA primase/polymerase n=1 Tax=Kitasatospora sp. NPDC048365 TaxID=3364050 RepID=UPI003714544F